MTHHSTAGDDSEFYGLGDSGDPNSDAAKTFREAVVREVRARGPEGMTVVDVREHFRVHHGAASSALSIAHRDGYLTRLADKRDRSRIYVLPSDTAGRVTQPYGRNPAPAAAPTGIERRLRAAYEQAAADAREAHATITELLLRAGDAEALNRASIEALRATLSQTLSAAQDASDAAWQAGYDQAKAEAPPEPEVPLAPTSIAEMIGRATRAGQRAEAERLGTMAMQMRAAMPDRTVARNHHGLCWQIHPACALAAIEKAAAKTVAASAPPTEAESA
jgi:hypothetical protein